MAFRSKLARYGSCEQVMPIPMIMKALRPCVPKPIYPLELPFNPTQDPFVPPKVVPIEIGQYPPKECPAPGAILANASGFLPPGYLKCDGSAVSRTTYAELFKRIGTYYGEGDFTTTFNLPKLDNDCDSNTIYIIKYDLFSDTIPYYPPVPCGDPLPAPPSYINIQILPYPQPYVPAPGTILKNTTNLLPDGYFSCNGAEVSRTTYAVLYNMIGTYYGVGDNVNTFNLPNLTNGDSPPYRYIIRYLNPADGVVPNPAVQIPVFPTPYVPGPGTILRNTEMYLPTGYLPCNGAALSRTEYYLLFSVIDTFYGAGNGTTTFNVPSLSNGTGNPNTYIIRYVEQVTPCVTITPQLNVAGVSVSGTESFNFS